MCNPHSLPYLSFSFPDVEDFLRNSPIFAEVQYGAFSLLSSTTNCEEIVENFLVLLKAAC